MTHIEFHDGQQPFYTVNAYWECNCSTSFVHPKSLQECPRCHATSGESPDARLNDLLPLVETGDKVWVVQKKDGDKLAIHGIYESAEEGCAAAKREVILDHLMLINQIWEKGGKAAVSYYAVTSDGYAVILDTEVDVYSTHDIKFWVMGYNKNTLYGYPLWKVTKGA